MVIHKNFELASYNTFGVNSRAEYYTEASDLPDLDEVLMRFAGRPVLPLGGGSNLLFTRDVEGLVLKNNFKGIELLKEDDRWVHIHIGAGEVWHDVVMHCVGNGWGGIENLSLIPGLAGAAPVQNIGAYGVEIKDVLVAVEAVEMSTRKKEIFEVTVCRLGYRDSIFKRELKGKYFITGLILRLDKRPEINISYGSISAQLKEMGVETPSIKDVSDAVIAIRQSKLPDPEVLGNAGSFFKNPVIDSAQFGELQRQFPAMHHYPAGGRVKIPAAWLIEQCGFKGYRANDIGCYEKQPLVIVNYGNPSGKAIYEFSQSIIDEVHARFGIVLEREVNVY